MDIVQIGSTLDESLARIEDMNQWCPRDKQCRRRHVQMEALEGTLKWSDQNLKTTSTRVGVPVLWRRQKMEAEIRPIALTVLVQHSSPTHM